VIECILVRPTRYENIEVALHEYVLIVFFRINNCNRKSLLLRDELYDNNIIFQIFLKQAY